jgi:hypothetical protein
MNDAMKPLAFVWLLAFLIASIAVHPAALLILFTHASVLALFFKGISFDRSIYQKSKSYDKFDPIVMSGFAPMGYNKPLRGLRNSNLIVDECPRDPSTVHGIDDCKNDLPSPSFYEGK